MIQKKAGVLLGLLVVIFGQIGGSESPKELNRETREKKCLKHAKNKQKWNDKEVFKNPIKKKIEAKKSANAQGK
ncbi:MAG TPA: hypothetical protein VEK38_00450 [Candidatus Bathyarchaeia archaeon]|nr:hypothetical protein [Candidatus Bathyarchaeia archaeon]